jgi:hypothetical protein
MSFYSILSISYCLLYKAVSIAVAAASQAAVALSSLNDSVQARGVIRHWRFGVTTENNRTRLFGFPSNIINASSHHCQRHFPVSTESFHGESTPAAWNEDPQHRPVARSRYWKIFESPRGTLCENSLRGFCNFNSPTSCVETEDSNHSICSKVRVREESRSSILLSRCVTRIHTPVFSYFSDSSVC